jgi:signal transduction histidine kinase
MRLVLTNAAYTQVRKENRYIPLNNTFRVGGYIILAILYLAFFIYNPRQKAYLFFFLYAICNIPADILQFNIPSEVADMLTMTSIAYGLWQVSALFLLTALYSLLDQKKGWIYWSLVLFTMIGGFINDWFYSVVLMASLVQIEQVRSGFRALKLHRRGAWIITTGAICFLFFEGTFVVGVYLGLDYWYYPLGNHYILADLLYAVGALCFPVSTTIYIALDFAFTGQRLHQKLIEVKELSKNKLEQEKEKQQILAGINETLEKQVSERTTALTKSLEDLKSTQTQLIQSEKMASLGELTAGIAHEIQNPLNFVNNFAEVSRELALELKEEVLKPDMDKQTVSEIAGDIVQNQEKIHHHGQRASSIVKGMLEHSRNSTGRKAPTDLNALADEYLRLAYHGFRAKDKSFHAEFITDLDPSLPKVNVVAQDIGRVLLNLINNAFYAVSEKANKGIPDYHPEVMVKTQKKDNRIEIRVKDNADGIPEKIKDKIFQPFFTTKPSGSGTGLGLSLSYDIITKGHNGTLEVDTTEGLGSEFIVQIPLNSQ